MNDKDACTYFFKPAQLDRSINKDYLFVSVKQFPSQVRAVSVYYMVENHDLPTKTFFDFMRYCRGQGMNSSATTSFQMQLKMVSMLNSFAKLVVFLLLLSSSLLLGARYLHNSTGYRDSGAKYVGGQSTSLQRP